MKWSFTVRRFLSLKITITRVLPIVPIRMKRLYITTLISLVVSLEEDGVFVPLKYVALVRFIVSGTSELKSSSKHGQLPYVLRLVLLL